MPEEDVMFNVDVRHPKGKKLVVVFHLPPV
jgi:hypothetical protein